ncbi:DUF2254 domain-containing protein [Desulfovibrio gilichinskyi]|uniref:Uncharacterized membrane protein n=1 Tax=Desulfovibrio gilichinskyi TaxID=1519643 RepID=A0A1X7EY16_9BACT|nr:DUF2254 domain-containing protein [Desulfovibrio gilichinskyi]SMF41772.1 Uncharacterized membrane protein [Desulfovibrio gilichinskyi]
MKVRLRQLWYHVTTSLWFIPGCLAVVAIAASFAMVSLDHYLPKEITLTVRWIYSGGPDSAIAILSAIASSTATVAGVVFSIIVVALTLASSQFGPRLLNNFLSDRVNQAVLGVYVATFIYSLLVLRTIRQLDEFVPHLSITVAILMSLASFFFLIFFIHHISSSIKADNIIDLVEKDLERIIEELFPNQIGLKKEGEAQDVPVLPKSFDEQAITIRARGTGYVQVVDLKKLIAIARDSDLILSLKYRSGDFVTMGTPLAKVWTSGAVPEELERQMNGQFILGRQRTPVNDIELCINQLVEIAIRALSSGVNDTFTAITCIDRLGGALAKLAGREMPGPYHYDDDGTLRIIAVPLTFAGIVEAACNLIRQDANISVMIRLLETLSTVASLATTDERREILLRQARMIVWDAKRRSIAPEDLHDILDRYKVIQQTAGAVN